MLTYIRNKVTHYRCAKSIVVIATLLIGCGQSQEAPKIDATLEPLLQEYIAAHGEGLLAQLLSLEYGEPGEENEAITYSFRLGGDVLSRIVIRPQASDCALRRAVWHELGHALHNLEHTQNRDDVMYEELVGASASWCASINIKLQEMF